MYGTLFSLPKSATQKSCMGSGSAAWLKSTARDNSSSVLRRAETSRHIPKAAAGCLKNAMYDYSKWLNEWVQARRLNTEVQPREHQYKLNLSGAEQCRRDDERCALQALSAMGADSANLESSCKANRVEVVEGIHCTRPWPYKVHSLEPTFGDT